MKQYTLNLSRVDTRQALHAKLQAALGLPAHYGANWDAFYDCAADCFGAESTLTVTGFFALPEALQREKQIFLRVMLDLQREGYPVTLELLP